MINIFIASDHAGYELKNHVVQFLKNTLSTHSVIKIHDLGPFGLDSVDYPDYANLVCEKMRLDSTSKGILICGSGQGMALRANKFSHIRAALVYSDEIVKLSREHNDANIICIGSRFASVQNAEKWINIFINTVFSGGRHSQRVDKISQST